MTHINPKTLIFTTHPHTMKLLSTHASLRLRAVLEAVRSPGRSLAGVFAAGIFAATTAGAQTLEVIKTFNGTTAFGDGTETWGNPCFDAAGNIYGCCNSGGVVSGAGTGFGGGTLWKLTPGGVFSVLTSFTNGVGVGGRNPQSGPQFGADGSLYGPNRNVDGSNNRGAIYRVTTAGVRTGVVDFPFTNNTAANPYGPIVRGPGGEIYGTTGGGGSFNFGSVWRVDAAGNFSTIVSLTRYDPPTQGQQPKAITVTPDGSVYFMADDLDLNSTAVFRDYIRIYKWTAGTLTSFAPFNSSTQGNQGKAMTLGSDGNFYVITRQLGSEIFRFLRMTLAGAVTLLQTLPSPRGGHDESLFQAADGHFYTITEDFPYRPARITLAGGYNVLSLPAGMNWVTGLAPGPGGYVYGVTNDNNTSDAFLGGAVFRFPITVPGPEIALEQPAGTDLADGVASIGFGAVNTGSSSTPQTFTVKNTGSGALTVTGIATSGGNAAEFAVSASAFPLNVSPAGSATFTVTFAPTAAGARSTTLQILSNDADEATFDIALTGTGIVPVDGDNDGIPDAWELLHFGAAGTTADADDDGDGMSSFGEYAFGLNPHSGDLTALPQPALSGGLMTITVTKRPYIAYTVVASESLAAGSFSVTGLTTVTDDATTLTVRETAAGSRRFMQIRAVRAP